ncbi:MAG: TlpA disulfide reductase family protein, partial [Planctomycetota bacterium]
DINLHPWSVVKPEVVAASAEFAGTPGAVPFLVWTVQMSSRTREKAEAVAALEALVKDHASDPRTVDVAFSLRRYQRALGAERTLEIARALERGAPNGAAKAEFALAAVWIEDLDEAGRIAALAALVERYPGTRGADKAAGWRFELEHLQVGMVVPELAGGTLDGGTFSLSALRGKVVVLEFWGVNCGPCMQKIPRTRERLGALAGAPFAHVGVQSDHASLETVRALAKERGITWTTVHDRSTDGRSFGPIGTRWNLSGWPTVFLIDHEGVIRSNWATEDVLEEMLPGLLERAQAAK